MVRRDFTLNVYRELLVALQEADYVFQTFQDYVMRGDRHERIVVLRHDVDAMPRNAFRMAELETELRVRASYYFRIVPQSFSIPIIRAIAERGHEIGYHYEDLSLSKGNVAEAIQKFSRHLNQLRAIYPVKTACMHGSPLSKWDNRDIWREFSYRDYGIIAEPYFDLDFDEVLYITDTGRSWNNEKYSRRDKVRSSFSFSFRSTYDFINSIRRHKLPMHIMINTHPERWNNHFMNWSKALIFQSMKNVFKHGVVLWEEGAKRDAFIPSWLTRK